MFLIFDGLFFPLSCLAFELEKVKASSVKRSTLIMADETDWTVETRGG